MRGRAGVNHLRFKGRIGRRALAPGTYALTVRGAERRRVVVIVGPQPRVRFDCYDSGGLALAASLPQFRPPAAKETARSAKKESRGVLPAITRKIRQLPKAVPPIPMPSMPREAADAPPAALGLLALALLALSAVAIVAYVIRFLRGPRAKSA
jgi:hypothetical protein